MVKQFLGGNGIRDDWPFSHPSSHFVSSKSVHFTISSAFSRISRGITISEEKSSELGLYQIISVFLVPSTYRGRKHVRTLVRIHQLEGDPRREVVFRKFTLFVWFILP